MASKRYPGLRYRLRSHASYWFSNWTIADALNYLNRTCWASLVQWVLYKSDGDPEEDANYKLRYHVSGGDHCRKYSTEHPDRTCYCGKFVDGRKRSKDWPPDGAA